MCTVILQPGDNKIAVNKYIYIYIRSYPGYRRPFLYPQPDDAPCRGDRDSLITAVITTAYSNEPLLLIRLRLFLFAGCVYKHVTDNI